MMDVGYLLKPVTESCKDLVHVPTLLHGDNSSVVFLVHPYQECLAVIVPNTTSIRPVTSHARGKKERRDGFVKEEVIL